jgi:hypothetical protein
MGTSSSSGGAGGNNPLVPSWIGGDEGFPPSELSPNPPNQVDTDNPGKENDNSEAVEPGETDLSSDTVYGKQPDDNLPRDQSSEVSDSNRFSQPRRQFNRFVQSGGRNQNDLRNALKGYSRNAAGGSRRMARRMLPAVSRVARFNELINTVRDQGKLTLLAQFNLGSYHDKPLYEVLSALSDAIFDDTGRIYEDTQDDSIAKHAYSNTVVRICDLEGIDLDNLTNQQVEVMTAIFIEETISQRVIIDIGNMLTEKNTNIIELIEIENSIYQIVSGMVRNQIMPEIIATQRGDRLRIEMQVENIYRIAFEALAGLNN